MTNLSNIKKQRMKQKRKNKIKSTLNTEPNKDEETVQINLEVPIYQKIEEVPNLEKGDVVYVKNREQIMIEDGT